MDLTFTALSRSGSTWQRCEQIWAGGELVSCACCGLAVHDLSQALQAILAKLLAYWPTWTKWTNLNSEYLYMHIKLKVNFIGYLRMPENLVETWEESRIVDPSLSPLRDLRSIASINPNKLGSTCLLQMIRLPAMSIERKCFTSSQIDLLTRPQHAIWELTPFGDQLTKWSMNPWPRIPTCSPIASVEWQLTWNLSLGKPARLEVEIDSKDLHQPSQECCPFHSLRRKNTHTKHPLSMAINSIEMDRLKNYC